VSAHREIPEPGEALYAPRPSWAPLVFAFSAAVAVCGVFIEFMLPGWTWSILAAIVLLAALRTMARGAVRDYFRRPRKQRLRGAALPVETISPPRS
jgi:hypothetical protein